MRKEGGLVGSFGMGAFAMPHVCLGLVWLGLVCLGSGIGWGQVPGTTGGGPAGAATEEMPKEAAALMLLAAKVNGLTGEDVQPWRLKASYTVLDEQGKAKEEGTFEELWVGPKKSRISYTSGGHTQTTYFTETGAYRAGDMGLDASLAVMLRNAMVEPLPNPEFVGKESFQVKEIETAGTKLECASMQGLPGSTYCFSADKPMLRVVISFAGTRQTLCNKIVRFQGRYVAAGLTVTRQGKPELTARLDSLESIKALDAADFTPPADAKLLPKKIAISSGVAQGFLIKQVPPVYPIEAKQRGVQGTVVLEAVIGKDGSMQEVRVVSGPSLLQQAALDAVRQWKYRAYLLMGEPVEVNTTINVVFRLG